MNQGRSYYLPQKSNKLIQFEESKLTEPESGAREGRGRLLHDAAWSRSLCGFLQEEQNDHAPAGREFVAPEMCTP